MQKAVLLIGKKSFIAQSLKKKLSNFFLIHIKDFNELNKNTFKKNYNYIINCSSYKVFKFNKTNKDRDLFIAKKIINTNTKLLMLSTSKVYGDNKNLIKKKEVHICKPHTDYGKSRLFVENKIKKIIPNQYLILRLANLINKDTRVKTKSKTAINQMINDLIFKKEITIPNEKTIKDFITINFLAEIVHKCIVNKLSGTYNVSSGFSTSLETVAKLLIKGYGSGIIKKKNFFTDRFILDNSKLYKKIKKKIFKKILYKEIIKIGKQIR